jgi:hypothetical protein
MPNPFLEADTIRFGEEEAIRMHALGTEKPEPVVLQTYTLQFVGPSHHRSHPGEQSLTLDQKLLRETEENLTDLLPAGYSVKIVAQS